MYKGTPAALLAVGMMLSSVVAGAQTRPNPVQNPDTIRQDQVPVFRVSVVGRSISAINFRPRGGETKIDFTGTTLLPRARGDATVEGKDGVIEIEANFERLEPATRFGPEYLTYVVWAITPEGRATNLGELQVSGDDGELRVTTELQAFGLIVTAEPYFAVTQPSDVVVLEAMPRKEGTFQDATVGRVETVQARYELLKRGTYLMNQDAARLKVKRLEPGAPLDLAEARNAVELAKLAGADRYAADTFAKATSLLAEAELARERRRRGNEVMQPARQAVQTAEDSRLIALQRQEDEFLAAQRAESQRRETAALDKARAEEAARRQAELDRQSQELLRQQAELERLNAERAAKDAEAARLAAERQRADIARQKAEADAARTAAEQARLAAEAQAEQARLAAEAQARDAQAAAAQAAREQAELRDKLRQQLNVILETRETARGLIVNLSDVLFDFNKANLKPGAREKLARVAGIVQSHPGLVMQVEGHTDNVGSDEYNQRLSEQRANSVRGYLVEQGIASNTIGTVGFGESQPVATNGTAAGRQQNRRVELVVTGEPIGREAEPPR